MFYQENPVASVFSDISKSLALTVLCMCAHVHTCTAQTLAVNVSGYSWCKCARCQQGSMGAPRVWVGAILLGGNSSLFLSCPGGGDWLWKRQGEGGVQISGIWEPEKETPSVTERAFERTAGLCDLAQVPSLANLLGLDKISKHSVSLRIVREQSKTS